MAAPLCDGVKVDVHHDRREGITILDVPSENTMRAEIVSVDIESSRPRDRSMLISQFPQLLEVKRTPFRDRVLDIAERIMRDYETESATVKTLVDVFLLEPAAENIPLPHRIEFYPEFDKTESIASVDAQWLVGEKSACIRLACYDEVVLMGKTKFDFAKEETSPDVVNTLLSLLQI